MQWRTKHHLQSKQKESRRSEITKSLLKNRNIRTKQQRQDFFNPQTPDKITAKQINLNLSQLKKAKKGIDKAMKNKELIIIYGDYDADGICATAILWEILNHLGAKVMPFIPHREKHGYGISTKGIDEIMNTFQNPSLIVTVDNGIVAHQAVEYAKKLNIDVIICDHHEKAAKLPKAYAILHSTKLAGAGLAWVVGKIMLQQWVKDKIIKDTLDLAAIGSVADMVPLLGPNRSIVKYGLEHLRTTKRIGILEICKESGIEPTNIDTYHINFILAPRINAMGRLGHAIESLRLLCTKNEKKAKELAQQLSRTNKKRQEMTEEAVQLAKQVIHNRREKKDKDIIIIEHEQFHEGIIGLIAGKLVEEFYVPVIVIAKREKISKASARSIEGFNIIEVMRKTSDVLIDVGGHPLAAGFTLETTQIELLKKKLYAISKDQVKGSNTQKQITIDCEIEMEDINWAFYHDLKKFEPYGMANPQPIFSFKANVADSRLLGANQQHLKLILKNGKKMVPILFFHQGDLAGQLKLGDKIKVAGVLNLNAWNGNEELQIRGIGMKNISS